jgi:homoserine dehydrogenase
VEFRYRSGRVWRVFPSFAVCKSTVGDEVEMLSGIINGCTSYMLTAMDKVASPTKPWRKRQRVGYADDPTLDVGGVRSSCIMVQ